MVNLGDQASRKKRKEEIAKRLGDVRRELDPSVTLIVVTKNFPVQDLEILHELGERNFGENRVQELIEKRTSLPTEVDQSVIWHYQGQIQSNKISLLNQHADVIHSIDSQKVIDRLSAEMEVFLQVNLDPIPKRGSEGDNSSRAGIDPTDLDTFALAMVEKFGSKFLGLMAVAPHFPGITSEDLREAFHRLQKLSEHLVTIAPEARSISAGMSDDYRLALEHGATHIRLGSSILGSRAPGA